MDPNERRVECPEHGSQPATYVCQHIVQSLKDGVPRGFLWPAGTGMERPDAWCVSCDEAVEATGWQPHSVRGTISGTLKKKLGHAVASEPVEGRGRVYRIAAGR